MSSTTSKHDEHDDERPPIISISWLTDALVDSFFTTLTVDISTVFIKSFIITPTLPLNDHLINYHSKDAPKHRCTAGLHRTDELLLYLYYFIGRKTG